MAERDERPADSARARAEALALAELAEAEAAEAEAVAAAARARARALRLRREAEAQAAVEKSNATAVENPAQTGDVTAATEPSESDDVTKAAHIEDSAEIEAGAAPSALERSGWRRWLPRPSVSALAKTATLIAILGFLAVSGYMLWYHNDTIERQQRTAAFAAAARQGVINLTSFDFKHAKQDVQRVLDSSTGEFKDDFQQRANDFTTVVEQSKVVTEGKVNSAAVESMGKDSAVVLVSATSHVTNVTGAKEEPREWRLRVTVADEGGQMKMSKVEFVP
ncbi:hypothetical protein [Mycobacterium botniense]|uniref:Mce associated membrane protein n=1 Tax=Mycobacterium botniense TaxID=84962 RepID=A0A7I9XZH5_9MYCO|nr:hypothetical protein [Mycobacterium botniense]GFG75222.1 hypothetical protein MBOT_25870 [Mycobacterium botniense]